jgi:ornithine carbamoyltransferase
MARHFLALHDYNEVELYAMLLLARELKAKQKQGIPHKLLEGKTLAMIFDKSSTRTRISFEVGIYQLGGHGLFISSGTSQMGRGEPIKDTARVLARYCDGVMIRTFGQEIVDEFAEYSSVPVINGLTDLFHPCQIMADIMTVIEHKRTYEGLKFAWVGDGNNMANTWIEAAAIFGFDLALACPEGYEPDAGVMAWARDKAPGRITLTSDPREAVAGADVLNTDVWASMGQEAEQEKRKQVFAPFQVNAALMAAAPNSARFMHCLPARRNMEVTDDVLDGPQSIVLEQAENRMHGARGVLLWLLGINAAG